MIQNREARRKGGKRRRWYREEWHNRVLRERYDSKTDTITELVELFGVPRWVVTHWAQELGLARTKARRWTEADENYVRRNYHKRNINVLARHLGRTTTAVALKAKRLELCKSGVGYTLTQACIGLGQDHKKMRRYIEAGHLQASRRETLRKDVQGGDMWLITERALVKFIRQYPAEINLKQVDQAWFLGLILQ